MLLSNTKINERTEMRIRFVSIYKECRNLGLWYLLHFQYKKYWNGELIYIGLRGWKFVIDKRGINSFQDFADALTYGKSWSIIRKAKKYFNPKP